jgi:5'-AMP-activated protein kinase catalytic alpha subunit
MTQIIAKWTAQLVSALKYCHSKGVCHRDMKSQNVFITESNDIRLGVSPIDILPFTVPDFRFAGLWPCSHL